MNRDLILAFNIGRYAMLKTRLEEQTTANFVGQRLRIEVSVVKLKPFAECRAKRLGGFCASAYARTP